MIAQSCFLILPELNTVSKVLPLAGSALLPSPLVTSSLIARLHPVVTYCGWQPFDGNVQGQFCWCLTPAWLLRCWHKEVAEEVVSFLMFKVETQINLKKTTSDIFEQRFTF